MKTNKSFTKRLKVTRRGKIIARKAGQNHFNAKDSQTNRLGKKKTVHLVMTGKRKRRFLPSQF